MEYPEASVYCANDRKIPGIKDYHPIVRTVTDEDPFVRTRVDHIHRLREIVAVILGQVDVFDKISITCINDEIFPEPRFLDLRDLALNLPIRRSLRLPESEKSGEKRQDQHAD